MGPLSSEEVESFILRGFVPLREAFPRALAERCRERLWEQLDVARADPSSWTKPVIRLGGQSAPPFCEAANTPRLRGAFDQLIGAGRWVAHPFLSGTVVVRFPVGGDPGDAGWHIDGSFAKNGSWWVNLRSDGRALLMLFLFSDVGADDAPTRIRIGSHLDVPAVLAPAGEAGLWYDDVVPRLPPTAHERALAHATGIAGDVYLCHPFLVHAADRHRGRGARFLGQPGVLWAAPLDLSRPEDGGSPVDRAIRLGLGASARATSPA